MKEKFKASRRNVLKCCAVAAVTAFAGGLTWQSTRRTVRIPRPSRSLINLVVWRWSIDFVKDRVNRFNAAHPEIDVYLTDISQKEYWNNVTSRLRTGTPTDLIYSSLEYQKEWELAGWIKATEDYFPEIRKYMEDIPPSLWPAFLSVEGKMFGLAHYCSYTNFTYNKSHLDMIEAAPPTTWNEIRSTAIVLKNRAIEYPMAANFGSYAFWQTLYSFIAGQNASIDREGIHYLFDEDMNPVMDKDSPLFNTIRWLIDVINVDKTMTSATVNYDDTAIITTLGAGKHSMVWLPTYDLIHANNPNQAEYENIKQALNPGTGITSAWLKLYNMTTYNASRDENTKLAQWKLHTFLGGKTDENLEPVENPAEEGEYSMCKRMFIERDLLIPYLSLWDDPDFTAAYNKYGDATIGKQQLTKTHVYQLDSKAAPWWGEWSGDFARSQLNALMLGQKGLSDADILPVLKDLADRWKQLKSIHI